MGSSHIQYRRFNQEAIRITSPGQVYRLPHLTMNPCLLSMGSKNLINSLLVAAIVLNAIELILKGFSWLTVASVAFLCAIFFLGKIDGKGR